MTVWVWAQRSGRLYRDGKFIAAGYAGKGEGLNSEAHQYVRSVGPIPVGTWIVGDRTNHPRTGPDSVRLSPSAGTETRGRAGFLVHGDNAKRDQSASEGCIVVERSARLMMRSADLLVVVPL